MSKYWNNEGKYNAEWNQLQDQLVPDVGSADTLAGEMIRAVNKLYYDAFNNGFCNNTSGAANFLDRYAKPMISNVKFNLALSLIEGKTNTGGYSTVDKTTMSALDLLVDSVYELILAQPQLKTTANPCDLYELQEPTYYEPEEEYDEEYDEEDEYSR
jgi:hypothetical protein